MLRVSTAVSHSGVAQSFTASGFRTKEAVKLFSWSILISSLDEGIETASHGRASFVAVLAAATQDQCIV